MTGVPAPDAPDGAPSTPAPPGRVPLAVRFQWPLLLLPFVAGIATAVALWGDRAPRLFFSTAAEVLALGAVAASLQRGIFRIRTDERPAAWRGVAMATLLISVGTGLGFALAALAREDGGAASHLAVTAGALALGAGGIAVQAIFGMPGAPEDD
jgi:hypothetical protein